MNCLKIIAVLLVSLTAISCVRKSEKLISTRSALTKYADVLKERKFFIFPELRDNSIKWYDSIQEEKVRNSISKKSFSMSAQPGEFYTFQIGVWALKSDLDDIQVEFSELKKNNSDQFVHAGDITCFNKGGTDFRGNAFTKKISVQSGRIQALWMGIDLNGVDSGDYTGSVSVIAGGEKQTIAVQLNVSGETVPNHGYNQGKRLSRLNWLNSNVGINDEITKGYIPVKVEENEISILGRTLNIARNGLPASITTFFSPSNQSLVEKGEAVVSHSFRFVIEKENGEVIRLVPGKLVIKEQKPSKVVWNVQNTSDECDLECTGEMEFDGFVNYQLKFIAKVPLRVKDIRLEIPVIKEKAEYMMGLGHEGGFRSSNFKWRWDVSKDQDMLWVGGVNGGLRIKWKAENYVRPLVNVYYSNGPLNLPTSWGNAGKGGVEVIQKNEDVVINAYSGTREIKPGEKLNYDFELLITPFKVIDRKIKFNDRYYHGDSSIASEKIEHAKKAGANIVNMHHAEEIYPFINYPMLDETAEDIKTAVAIAHKDSLQIKLYNTTRELTVNLPEFWAFNSLNGEIFFPGPGNESRSYNHKNGPDEWLKKNLREKYLPAWVNIVPEGKLRGSRDLSVITTPDGRLNNFYVAGLEWMIRNLGIDGVYIDDTALDRFTLRRARKVIDQNRPNGRMDLHSWNHFNQWAGFASCLNIYMDLLPYFDLTWIGEWRDYNRAPDNWMVEVSGIPFGLPGQMLQDGGNPWRGMIYGITSRGGYTKPDKSPEYLWRYFDEYLFQEREMIGYWDRESPVSCNNPMVKVSIYKSEKDLILAVANWSDHDEKCSIVINWVKLGIDPARFEISIPEIRNFQAKQNPIGLDTMTIPGGKGYLILVKRKK